MQHNHDAITILGTRGSGKTSFLLSLNQNFKDNKHIEILKIIDPTLIEEKGHIFLTIIASVAETVETHLKDREINAPKNAIHERSEWKNRMMDLAAGLPGLDGIGKDNTEGWQDPEFVMDTGLVAVRAAKNLAVNFDLFLQASLKILGKQAFLIFFDDIDVNAKKGIDVLETVRKYLVTRRVITVISGDLALYMLVIRNKKWENFGTTLLKCEGELLEKMPSFNNKVAELTAQYLLKVMQPAYRIHLMTLLQKKNTGTVKDILISTDGELNGEAVDITSFYHGLYNSLGVCSKTQLEVFTTYMLGLPVRTQIQFCLLCKNIKEDKAINTEAISDVFIADLAESRVDISLVNHTPKYYCSIALELLLRRHKLLDLYQMEPTTTDGSLNGSIMALWMLYSWYTKSGKSFLIFDYFIKVAYIRNLLSIIPYRGIEEGRETGRLPDIEDLCEVGDVFNDGVLRDVTSAIQSYVLGAQQRKGVLGPISPFFTRLYGLKSIAKTTRSDTIDAVFDKRTKAESILAYMPCYNSTYAYKNQSRVMFSIYVLLGAIGELIKRHEIVEPSEKELQEALKQLSQFRSYIIPDFRDGGNTSQDEGTSIEEADDLPEPEPDDNDRTDVQLAGRAHHWMAVKKDLVASTHLLGKMLTRFYYAMNNIADAASRVKEIKLGQLFHYQVTAFMNAVLVEDVTENADIRSLNINNTRLSDVIFLGNLQKVVKMTEDQLKKLNLSKWLLSCPLLHAYLRWDDNDKRRLALRKQLETFCGDYRHPESFESSIAHELDAVGILSLRVKEAGTPELLKDYDELIRYLRDRKTARSWFNSNKNPAVIDKWNSSIIQKEGTVFGTGLPAVAEIEKFREYLKNNKEKWK